MLPWWIVNHQKFVWSLVLVSWEMNLGMLKKILIPNWYFFSQNWFDLVGEKIVLVIEKKL